MEPEERAQLSNEIEIARSLRLPYNVQFYGVNIAEGSIYLYMEVMPASLHQAYTALAAMDPPVHFPDHVMGRIALSALRGLSFLKDVLRVLHRGTL